MANIISVFKTLANKARQGEKLSNKDLDVLRNTKASDLRDARQRGEIDEDDEKVLLDQYKSQIEQNELEDTLNRIDREDFSHESTPKAVKDELRKIDNRLKAGANLTPQQEEILKNVRITDVANVSREIDEGKKTSDSFKRLSGKRTQLRGGGAIQKMEDVFRRSRQGDDPNTLERLDAIDRLEANNILSHGEAERMRREIRREQDPLFTDPDSPLNKGFEDDQGLTEEEIRQLAEEDKFDRRFRDERTDRLRPVEELSDEERDLDADIQQFDRRQALERKGWQVRKRNGEFVAIDKEGRERVRSKDFNQVLKEAAEKAGISGPRDTGRGKGFIGAGAAVGASAVASSEEVEAFEAEDPGSLGEYESAVTERQRDAEGKLPETVASDRAFYAATLESLAKAGISEDFARKYLDAKRAISDGLEPREYGTIRQFVDESNRVAQREAVRQVLQSADLSDQEKEDIVRGFIAQQEDRQPTLREVFAVEMAKVDNAVTEQGADIETGRMDTLLDVMDRRANEAELVQNLTAEIGERGFDKRTALELLDLMTPFVEQLDMKDMAELLSETGFEYHALDFLNMGSLKRRLAGHILNMPEEQRIEMLKKGIELAKSDAGFTMAYIDDNKLAQLNMLDSFLRQEGPKDWEVVVDNVIGWLDVAGFGLTIRAMTRIPKFLDRIAKSSKAAAKEDMKRLPKPPVETPPKKTKPRWRYMGVDANGKARWRSIPQDELGVKPGTPQDTLNRSNPESGASTARAAMEDPTGRVAEALNVRKEEILFTHYLPKPLGSDWEGAPSGSAFAQGRLARERMVQLDLTSSMGAAFTAEEKALARAQEWENLQNVTGVGLHLNKSVMYYNGEGIESVAVYGKNNSHGFATLEDAQETRAFIFGRDDPDSDIVFEDFSTGTATPIEEIEDVSALGAGQFFIRRTESKPYNFIEGKIFGPMASLSSKLGAADRWILDPASRFPKVIRDPAFIADDNAAMVQRTIVREVNRTWPRKQQSKIRVAKALIEGDKQKRVFNPRELATMGLNQKERDAYYTYREAADTLWALQNRDLYNTMRQAGHRTVRTQSGDRFYAVPFFDFQSAWGSVRQKIPQGQGTVEVVDAVSGDPVTLTRVELGRLYDNNEGIILRQWHPMVDERGRHDFVLIRHSDLQDKRAFIDALDRAPMGYRKGHVPRIYKENWFVRMKPKNARVNGHKVEPTNLPVRTIGATTTRRQAEKLKNDLMAEAERRGDADNYEYIVTPDRSRADNPVDRARRDWEVMQSRRLTNQRRRGEHLRADVSPDAEYQLAEVEDPFLALTRTARATSQHVAYDQTLSTLRRRFMDMYGDFVGGSLPADAKAVERLGRDKDVDPNRIADAQAFRQYIAMLERAEVGYGDAAFADMMFSLAERLETGSLTGEFAAQGARKLAHLQPIKRARTIPFIMFLALNPARQFLIQSGQLAQLAGLDPAGVARLARELPALAVMRATMYSDKASEHGLEAAAAMMGISKSEAHRIQSALFVKSGLLSNIDQHLLVSGLVDPFTSGRIKSDNFFLRTWQEGASKTNQGIRLAKALGFDFGESTNVAGTFMIARRRWMRENPEIADKWDQKENLDQITALARQMSFSMTRPGRFGYQDGLLAVPLQFFQVPHKAFNAAFTTRMYSKTEKKRIIAANIALFGGSGMFLMDDAVELVEDELGWEIPPRLRQVLVGGLVDFSFNLTVDTMFADNDREMTNVLLSENFSPYADVTRNIGAWFEFTDLTTLEWMARAVPAGSAASRIMRSVRDVRNIFNSKPWDELTTDDAVKALMAVSAISSGFSNYWKYRYMIETGKAISASGNETVSVNVWEARARVFGLSTQDEKDYYDAIGEIVDKRQQLKSDADYMYESLKRIYSLYSSDPDKMDAELAAYRWALGVVPSHERQIIWERVRQRAEMDRKSGEQSLFELILRAAAETGGGPGGLDALKGLSNQIQNFEGLDPQRKQELDRLIRGMFQVPEETRPRDETAGAITNG